MTNLQKFRLARLAFAFVILIGAIIHEVRADPIQDIYLDVHILSHHWADPPYREYKSGKRVYEDWNETNQGLGLDIGFTENLSFIVGKIENSYDIFDWYAGADIHTDRSSNGFGVGVSLAYAPGYIDTPSSEHVVAPNVFYQYKKVKAKLSGFPGEYVGLTISWKFK